MAIITVFTLPTMTGDSYDQVILELEAAGQGMPEGRLYHAAIDQDDGSIVVADVWESSELLEEFGKTLIPILERNGVTPVEPKVYPTRNTIAG